MFLLNYFLFLDKTYNNQNQDGFMTYNNQNAGWVGAHLDPVFSQALLLVQGYKWPHNPPIYREIVIFNCYQIHIALKVSF